MGLHIHDRSGFSALDSYRINLDTDSNPATGAPAEASPLIGAEFVIDVTPQASILSAWNGSAFAGSSRSPDRDRMGSRAWPGTPDLPSQRSGARRASTSP